MNYLETVMQLSRDDLIIEFNRMYKQMLSEVKDLNNKKAHLERECMRLTLLLEGDNSIQNSLKNRLE